MCSSLTCEDAGTPGATASGSVGSSGGTFGGRSISFSAGDSKQEKSASTVRPTEEQRHFFPPPPSPNLAPSSRTAPSLIYETSWRERLSARQGFLSRAE